MHANVKLFSCSQKNNIYSPCFHKPTLKKSQDVQFVLLPHHIKIPPGQMKSVQENEASIFVFADHVTPRQGQGKKKKKVVLNGRSQWCP